MQSIKHGVVGLSLVMVACGGETAPKLQTGLYEVSLEIAGGNCEFYINHYNVQTQWAIQRFYDVWWLSTLEGNLEFHGFERDDGTLIFTRPAYDVSGLRQEFRIVLWPQAPQFFEGVAIDRSIFTFKGVDRPSGRRWEQVSNCKTVWDINGQWKETQ